MLNPYSIDPLKSDFIANILGRSFNMDDNIYIFGAGSATKNLIYFIKEVYKLNVVGILSNKPTDNNFNYDIPIVSPNNAKFKNEKILVLSTNDRDSIIEQLLGLGIKRNLIFMPSVEHLRFYTHIFQWHFSQGELLKKSSDIDFALSLYEDDSSKRLFLHRLGLLSNGLDYQNYCDFISDFSYLVTYGHPNIEHPENYFYFNNELVNKSYDTYIDVGAYTGDSVDQFIKYAGFDCKKIYCIEPNITNFHKLRKNLSNLDIPIYLFNKAAWSHKTTLPFSAAHSEIPSLTSHVNPKTDSNQISFVDSMQIDDLNLSNEYGLIKFDIEGSELQALNGSQHTLNKNQFDLIISAYHQKDDFIFLPILLNNICKHYKFYLRLFSSSFLEMVVIAKYVGK